MCSETFLKVSNMAATHTEMSLNTPITWNSVECHREHTQCTVIYLKLENEVGARIVQYVQRRAYGSDWRVIWVRFPAWSGNFSLQCLDRVWGPPILV